MTVRDLIITLMSYNMDSKIVFELNGMEEDVQLDLDGVENDEVVNEIIILLSK